MPSRVRALGSGTVTKPGAAIRPVPEKTIGAVGDGSLSPMAFAKPLAPLNLPVPPIIVKTPVFACDPKASGALKVSTLVPKNVFAPALNEKTKLEVADITPKPDGKKSKVMVPMSE